MSYYAPTFGLIHTGWYRSTSDQQYASERHYFDAFWNPRCDEIVLKYVSNHGRFFIAFVDEMLGGTNAFGDLVSGDW